MRVVPPSCRARGVRVPLSCTAVLFRTAVCSTAGPAGPGPAIAPFLTGVDGCRTACTRVLLYCCTAGHAGPGMARHHGQRHGPLGVHLEERRAGGALAHCAGAAARGVMVRVRACALGWRRRRGSRWVRVLVVVFCRGGWRRWRYQYWQLRWRFPSAWAWHLDTTGRARRCSLHVCVRDVSAAGDGGGGRGGGGSVRG